MSISVDPVEVGLVRSVPSAARGGKVRHVLFALTADRTARRALQEADSFARRLGAELHLIRVVPYADPDVQGPPRHLVQAVRDAQRVLAAARHTRKLCDRLLPEPLPSARICVRLGSLVDQVAQRASELDALFIVVPPGTQLLARMVVDLVRRSNSSVLVPKGYTSFVRLLAATDLKDPRTPVLEKAAELGRGLDADVIAMHTLVDEAGRDSAADLEACRERLGRATRALSGRLEPIVRRAIDPVQGILEQARVHNVGLIVVGTRARSGRLLPSTATQLVRTARRSVLVASVDLRCGVLSASVAT